MKAKGEEIKKEKNIRGSGRMKVRKLYEDKRTRREEGDKWER